MVKSLYMKSKNGNSQRFRTFHSIWAKSSTFNSHYNVNKISIRRDSSPGEHKKKKTQKRLGNDKEKLTEKEALK